MTIALSLNYPVSPDSCPFLQLIIGINSLQMVIDRPNIHALCHHTLRELLLLDYEEDIRKYEERRGGVFLFVFSSAFGSFPYMMRCTETAGSALSHNHAFQMTWLAL